MNLFWFFMRCRPIHRRNCPEFCMYLLKLSKYWLEHFMDEDKPIENTPCPCPCDFIPSIAIP